MTMKHFEPIVIQESNDVQNRITIEPSKSTRGDVIDMVVHDDFAGDEWYRRAFTIEAATRLRDALNTILND